MSEDNTIIENQLKKLGYWNDIYSKKNYFGTGPTKLAIFAKELLEKNSLQKILELGCGQGRDCLFFAKQGFDVTCLDLSKNALKKSKSLFNHMSLDGEFTQGTLFNLPIRDEQFNVVFNQGVMEHFRLDNLDPSKGVKEMMRVLKNNGTLVIFVPAYFSPVFFIYHFVKMFSSIEKHWPYEDQDFLRKHELFDMMEKAGCKNITVRRLWSSLFFSLIGCCKKQ